MLQGICIAFVWFLCLIINLHMPICGIHGLLYTCNTVFYPGDFLIVPIVLFFGNNCNMLVAIR